MFSESVVAVGLLISADGHGHPVVLRLAQRVALALAYAHDGVGNPVHANLFADGISLAQNFVHDVIAHDRFVCAVLLVGGRKPAPHRDIDVVQRQHRPRVPAHIGIVAGVAVVEDVCRLVQRRAHIAALGTVVAHRLVVLDAHDLAPLETEIVLSAEDHARLPRYLENVSAVA